jgi:predicted nucleotidyltransferase
MSKFFAKMNENKNPVYTKIPDQNEIISKLKIIKEKYDDEGFIILGYFGSFARGDQDIKSDIDILYKLNDTAIEKYPGFRFMELYGKAKADLERELGLKVDLAERNSLSSIGEKYILPEVRYVA